MKVRMSLFFGLCFLFGFADTEPPAKRKVQVCLDYISKYSEAAIHSRNKYKVPAAITLAQGILESGAGMSELAKVSNNHFGIKSNSQWKGEQFCKNDDPDECYRKYDKVDDSYDDHARFLLRPHYTVLFTYDPRDYVSWAKGLQACGYAADKGYANKLIGIIENYELYEFDKLSSQTNEKPVAEKPVAGKPVVEKPVAERPVAERPVTERPAAERPVAERPAAEKQIVEKPTVGKPVAEKPVVEKPTVGKPVVEKPAVQQPTAQQPAAQQPTAQQPTVQQPAAQQPASAKQQTGEKPETVEKKETQAVLSREIYKSSGLIYVLAKDKDTFDQIADDTGFRVDDLVKFNEIPRDYPLKKGDIVYLIYKKKEADKPYFEHLVKIGESMHSIAQKYGIQVESLYRINQRTLDYVPNEGDVLKLR